MKISFIPPREVEIDSWRLRIPKELEKLGYEVLVNDVDKDCKLIIIYSQSQVGILEQLLSKISKPFICYAWDWFEHIDKFNIWSSWIDKMKKANEIWVPTEDVKNNILKDLPELKNIYKIPGYIEPEEWQEPFKDKRYVVQASYPRFYKRFEFFEKGCLELEIPFYSCSPMKYPRDKYIEIVKNCSIMISCSLVEGFGITPVEGAICKKPLLLTDIPVFRENWGDSAIYFEKDSLEDFKNKLKKMWEGELKPNTEKALNIVRNNFFPEKVALKINERLNNYENNIP